MIHFLGSAESCFAYCRRDVYSLDLRQPSSVRSAFAAGSFSDRILDPEQVSPSYDFSESRPVQRAFCVCTGPWASGSSWRFFLSRRSSQRQECDTGEANLKALKMEPQWMPCVFAELVHARDASSFALATQLYIHSVLGLAFGLCCTAFRASFSTWFWAQMWDPRSDCQVS